MRRPTKDLGRARVREKGAEAMGALDLAGKEEGLEERRAVEAAEQAMREEEEGGNGQHKVRLRRRNG